MISAVKINVYERRVKLGKSMFFSVVAKDEGSESKGWKPFGFSVLFKSFRVRTFELILLLLFQIYFCRIYEKQYIFKDALD